MKNLVIMLTFRWDDGDETGEYVLTVPDSVTALQVTGIIEAAHDMLCDDVTGEDIYGINGRNAETLLNYVCEKEGWNWKQSECDAVITLV